jgi:succinate dehydrogenase / fumarate reductase, cytochrome b subunit
MSAIATRDTPWLLMRAFWSSSIGAKITVALSGIVLWGFLIGHMIGNLQVYLWAPADGYIGQQLNEYAHNLKSLPPLLWGTRLIVLVAFIVHVVTTVRLVRANRQARPVRYQQKRSLAATIASRSMAGTGIVLLLFAVMHILHFTVLVVDPSYATLQDQAGLPDVYQMVRVGFAKIGFVLFYVFANTLLVVHLAHGAQSVWQSLGIYHRIWTPVMRYAGWALVAALLAGNLSIPVVLYVWSLQSTAG